MIADAAKQDPAFQAWFCAVDAKVKGGDISLGTYDKPAKGPAAGTSGFADSNTAAVEKTSVKKLQKQENLRTLGEVASILVHELDHVSNTLSGDGCSTPPDESGAESSECACEHAGAYAKQLSFSLLIKKTQCGGSEAYPSWFATWITTQKGGYSNAHDKWLAARDKCLEGKETPDGQGHGKDPLGTPPGDGPGTLPQTSENQDCGQIDTRYPDSPGGPGGPGGSGGGSGQGGDPCD